MGVGVGVVAAAASGLLSGMLVMALKVASAVRGAALVTGVLRALAPLPEPRDAPWRFGTKIETEPSSLQMFSRT